MSVYFRGASTFWKSPMARIISPESGLSYMEEAINVNPDPGLYEVKTTCT